MVLPTSPTAARRLWALQTFVLLVLLWLALDGTGALVAGFVFAVLGAAAGAWLAPGEPYPWRPWRLLAFLGYFVAAAIRGGVDAAWRALHPRLPIDPCQLDYPTSLPAGLPRTTFASLVSLVPGTLSVELHDDGRLRVHALTSRGVVQALGVLEARVATLFSLPVPPPAPRPDAMR